MEPKRVGIYARVSTQEQTCQNQLIDLRNYVDARGWVNAGEFVDHGVSGAQEDRPALKQVMALARKRRIDVLLVWRFDRLARSLPHLVNTLEELRTLGVGFASFQEGVDTATAQGRMVFGIFASLAEFERSIIVDRIMAGLRRARTQGKRLGRPKTVSLDVDEVRRLRRTLPIRHVAKTLGTSVGSIQRALYQNPGQKTVELPVGAFA